MVVVRSMEVAQKKTTASFKALDGTIRTVNRDTGERVTLSHKCTELDKSLPIYLGVSKPILEHVMFCHQEESSWPLREGAELKKRFDDIFDSTRFAKALDAIKTERKTYASLAKDLKAELEGLNSHKFAACGFREELEECKVTTACINSIRFALHRASFIIVVTLPHQYCNTLIAHSLSLSQLDTGQDIRPRR